MTTLRNRLHEEETTSPVEIQIKKSMLFTIIVEEVLGERPHLLAGERRHLRVGWYESVRAIEDEGLNKDVTANHNLEINNEKSSK